jgi:hypothetical protein
MAIRQDEMTSANNKNAETGLPAYKPPKGTNVNGMMVDGSDDPVREGDSTWLTLVQQAKSAVESYQSGPKMRWQQAYRAYNNQHFSDSKYLSDRWRGRSKLHRPKTRNSVHKADARAATALFASHDIVQTTASNPANEKDQASADILREVLNYRLSRSSGKAGLPWFPISIGAHNDARLTGICVSKQYWERREVWNGKVEPIMAPPQPITDEMGQPAIDPMSGQPIMGEPQQEMEPGEDGQLVGKVKRIMKVVRDRPMVRLYPVEYVWRDPASDWLDQAQNSSYIGLLHPMAIGDAFAMLNDDVNSKSPVKWRPLTKDQLAHCGQPTEATAVQAARETDTNNRRDIKTGNQDYNTCWMIEWFVRKDGREYHFWTGACMYIASEPVLVEEAYPFCGGERPIVIGVSALEPHKIDPMSPVQAALPLQQEMNDLVNLRMDGVKENVRPLTIVRAGAGVDANTIQNRSGDTVIYTKEPETDIKFDRPASIGGEAYEEMAHLNADFDDTTGEFNGASVAMNRQIGETVGGMKLLNTSANITGDFDLTIWISTWVEPVLRQLMRVIQYYEDDQNILAIGYNKAKLFTKYGIDEISNDLLDREVMVTVDCGIGTSDPNVALERFAKASVIIGQILGQEVQSRAKQDAFIDEVYSKAGFKGAAERFFHPGDQTDPRITQLKEALGKMQAELESKEADRANKIEVERIKSATELLTQYLSNIATIETAEVQHEQNMEGKVMDQAHDTTKTKMAGDQRLKEIKAKPAPGGKPTASAKPPAKTAAAQEGEPTGGDPMMKTLLMGLMGQLIPQVGGPLSPANAGPGAGGGQPAAPPQPDPAQVMMQQMAAQMAQQGQMMMAQMQQLQQAMLGMMQAQQQLATVMAAPKTIMRDASGRAQGIQISGMGAPAMGAPALPAPATVQ